MRLLTIIGARPQIIKAAAISRAIAQHHATAVEEHLLHTGQHYDQRMSQVFFDELGIPAPTYNLGVGSGSHGWQTARMLEGIEKVLTEKRYDGVVVYGDTNSTLAGTLAASKLHIPVFHIEAGLRSNNMAMPEEQNRIVADHLGTRLYAPTATAIHHLQTEGLASRAICCGDVMLDNTLHYLPQADASNTLQSNGLQKGCYALATLHRDFNTDQPERLRNIVAALGKIAQTSGEEVVLPLHPRTANRLSESRIALPSGVKPLPPASYLEMLALEHGARMVLTDSGGVQKEAFFAGRPCIIMRPETEWEEIVDAGAAILADADPQRIAAAYQTLAARPVANATMFGDGHAAEHIVNDILNYIK